jgi:hypothetical protein
MLAWRLKDGFDLVHPRWPVASSSRSPFSILSSSHPLILSPSQTLVACFTVELYQSLHMPHSRAFHCSDDPRLFPFPGRICVTRSTNAATGNLEIE